MSDAKKRAFESHVIKPVLKHLQSLTSIGAEENKGDVLVRFDSYKLDIVEVINNCKHTELKAISPRYYDNEDAIFNHIIVFDLIYKGREASVTFVDTLTSETQKESLITCVAIAASPRAFHVKVKDAHFDVKARQLTKFYLYTQYTKYTDHFINNDDGQFVKQVRFNAEDYGSEGEAIEAIRKRIQEEKNK